MNQNDLLFLFILLSSSFSFVHSYAVGTIIQTSSGAIVGHAARNRTQVSEYLGIPYAKPPVGNLRFAAPQSYWSSDTLNGSAYSPDCPQNGLKAPPLTYPNQTPQFNSIVNSLTGGRGNLQSEDCLTLNIWTKDPSSHQRKGVLIWIHGGGFTVGDTNTPYYQGQYLVDAEDIVFVSINYRLNIFGFSGAPGEPCNVGLLDQRKAIEWVYHNIAGFGGDPARISIMGQSAGGASVDYYSYAYREHPIVAGLISHSGTSHSFEPNTIEFSQNSFLSAASLLGCNGPTVVDCMREQDFTAVLEASSKVEPLPSFALSQPVFHPTVDNVTVFDNYSAMSAAGSFAKIPYLVGSTDREDGLYRIPAAAENRNLTEQQWFLFNLQGFTCAAARAAFARVKAGVPVWRFRYFGDWPNIRLYPGSSSYHGTDLQMIFGGIEDIVGPGFPNSAAEEKTMRHMMRAWAAFVKRPATGLSRAMNWPRYNPWKDSLVRLGYEGKAGSSFVSPGIYDRACPKDGRVAEAQGAF